MIFNGIKSGGAGAKELFENIAGIAVDVCDFIDG